MEDPNGPDENFNSRPRQQKTKTEEQIQQREHQLGGQGGYPNHAGNINFPEPTGR